MFLPPIDSKYAVLPAIMTDITTMAVEAQLANEGALPFWYYSFRHYIRFFDLIVLIMVFVAMKRMADRIKSHPYLFTTVIKNEIQESNDY